MSKQILKTKITNQSKQVAHKTNQDKEVTTPKTTRSGQVVKPKILDHEMTNSDKDLAVKAIYARNNSDMANASNQNNDQAQPQISGERVESSQRNKNKRKSSNFTSDRVKCDDEVNIEVSNIDKFVSFRA